VPKKSRKRRLASILPWPADLFTAIEIEGEPVPIEATKAYTNPKVAELAARYWARRISWEIAALVPEDQSHDAELFAMRHRASILSAFHRRLKRADVIAAILALFRGFAAPSA
jgi:hypothetical protein